MLNILHISNDFGGTEVYRNLYQHLDRLRVKQIIFVPLNPNVLYRRGNHDFVFETEGSKIIYSVTQKWYHKYLFNKKISQILVLKIRNDYFYLKQKYIKIVRDQSDVFYLNFLCL